MKRMAFAHRNLILCGFMGCGKSTVGRELARLGGLCLVDMDEQVEREAGKPIPEIFSQEGEPAFRSLEAKALARLCLGSGQVISTGGGALLRPENAALARAGGLVVLLECPFSVCYARIQHSSRPLVRRSSPAELEALYQARLPLYRAACHRHVNAQLPPEEVAQAILRL